MTTEGLRRCPTCKESLPLSSFTPSALRRRQGRDACKECAKIKRNAYRAENRDKVRQQESAWYYNHRDRAMATHRKQKYGLTAHAFDRMLLRQHERCLGCHSPITGTSGSRGNTQIGHVDHDHKTGKVRGLLCQNCNHILGAAKDDQLTLRRLMAYLDSDYDRTKVRIYLAGTLKNTRIPEIGTRLRAEGFDVMDEWYTPGEFADTNWQAYEVQRGRTYSEALRGRAATNIYLFDRAYIDLADIMVLVMPVGKSAMIELGYAKGMEKYVCIFLDGVDPDRYDIMPNFADALFSTEEALIVGLNEIRKQVPV